MRELRGNEIAMIFQEPMTSLNPVFTCGEQVMEAIIIHQKITKKEAKEKTIALFKEVQLPRPESIFDAYPHQISGGQKQRLFIALALINDPELVFLDELTTGLDPQARRAIWELVRGIRARGKTVFLTTHLMEEAERLCDRVAIIDHGRIVDIGRHADLMQTSEIYRSLYSRQFNEDPAAPETLALPAPALT